MYEDAGVLIGEVQPCERAGDRAAAGPPARVTAIGAAIGASGFAVFFAGPVSAGSRLVPVVDNCFPGVSQLSRRLSSREADGIALELATGTRPLAWRSEAASDPLMFSRLGWVEEVAWPAADRETGIAFPVFDTAAGRRGVIAFAGERLALDAHSLCQVHWDCFEAFAEVARERPLEVEPLPVVSRREVECLKLTSNGMTSEDIAAELGLSVHTANQYLANGTQKLNAVNRVHAVAKALHLGLID